MINVGSLRMSEFDRYKRYKPLLKPCRSSDITKHINYEIAKDTTMNCDLWYELIEKS